MHMPFFIAPFIFLSQTKNNDVSVKNLKKHGLIQLNLFLIFAISPTNFFQFPLLRVISGFFCPIHCLNTGIAALAAATFPRLGADGFV